MANTNHNYGTQPTENLQLWRYMDFAKFANLLSSSSLFFTRADIFEDTHEGIWNKGTLRKILNIKPSHSSMSDVRPHSYTNEAIKFQRKMRKEVFINCWHISEYESDAMWKLYGLSNQTIAIKTTYNQLNEALPNNCITGCVKYIDYNKDWIPMGSHIYPFFRKRKSFEHEREFRALIQNESSDSIGINIKVDLNLLLNSVVLSPKSPSWYLNTISIMLEKFNIHTKVTKSELLETPNYI